MYLVRSINATLERRDYHLGKWLNCLHIFIDFIGAKCYGSTSGSNPERVGSIPTASAKLSSEYKRGQACNDTKIKTQVGLVVALIRYATSDYMLRLI